MTTWQIYFAIGGIVGIVSFINALRLPMWGRSPTDYITTIMVAFGFALFFTLLWPILLAIWILNWILNGCDRLREYCRKRRKRKQCGTGFGA